MIATLLFMGLVIGSNNLAAALAIGTLGAGVLLCALAAMSWFGAI